MTSPTPRLDQGLLEGVFEKGALATGTMLGRYELILPIARGGMARVWAARLHGERGFSKLVALKTILPELADDPVFERMFLEEAHIASALHHPNACEIYELGEAEGILYLAMEWVAGDALARVLKKSGRGAVRCDPVSAARVVADACGGLHAMHELTDDNGELLRVVHRDVSPQNILVTPDGNAKIADFGIAKIHGHARREHTAFGVLKGKRSYMSPEYVCGEPLDRRADVFSMGATLYEATTGVLPFHGPNEIAMLQALADGRLVPPSAVVRDYPAELEAIVLRAMENDPARRFPTADAMRNALEGWLARTAGPHARRRVADLVRRRVGDEITTRARDIRAAMTASTERRALPASTSEIRSRTVSSELVPIDEDDLVSSDPLSATRILPLDTPSSSSFSSSAVLPPILSVAHSAPRGRARLSFAAGAFAAITAGALLGLAAFEWSTTSAAAPTVVRAPSPLSLAPNATPSTTSTAIAPPPSPSSVAPTTSVRVMTPNDLPAASALHARSAPPVAATLPRPRGVPRDEPVPENPYAKRR